MSEHTPLTEAGVMAARIAYFRCADQHDDRHDMGGPGVCEDCRAWGERVAPALAARTSTATADTGHLYAPCKGREDALDELSGHAFNVWCRTNEDTQDDEVIDMFRREFAPWLDRIVDGAADTGLRERVGSLTDEWETAHGDPPIDPSHISVRHAKTLRRVLDATAASTTDTKEKS